MVPDDSCRIPRVPHYSGCTFISYTGPCTRLSLSAAPLSKGFHFWYFNTTYWRPYYPQLALQPLRFGLLPFRSPLLRELLLFSFPAGTKMFQFPTFACQFFAKPTCRRFTPAGCPIRRSTDQRLFAPHHSFSQLITSFFATKSHRHPPYALPF